MTKSNDSSRLIAENRRARFDYFIEERYEAGLALEGWEVKAMRAGRAQLSEAYVYLRGGEAFLIGAHLSPLRSTSTHVTADPVRTRKLLLNYSELRSCRWGLPRARNNTTSAPCRRIATGSATRRGYYGAAESKKSASAAMRAGVSSGQDLTGERASGSSARTRGSGYVLPEVWTEAICCARTTSWDGARRLCHNPLWALGYAAGEP